jgi:hypothetical protein
MMRMFVVSFVFGFLSVGLVLLCFSVGLAIVADVRGWGSFSIGSGVLTIIEYQPTPQGTETVIGPGTITISLLAGIMNAVAGTVLWSRVSGRR